MCLLILSTLVARLLFAGALGLGIDESYMVATGRELHLSYLDHPPPADEAPSDYRSAPDAATAKWDPVTEQYLTAEVTQ